jgi:hypothetical protein
MRRRRRRRKRRKRSRIRWNALEGCDSACSAVSQLHGGEAREQTAKEVRARFYSRPVAALILYIVFEDASLFFSQKKFFQTWCRTGFIKANQTF